LKRNSGFTLIELMIVVSVFAVVVAVAIPTLQQSRKSASATQAIGLLKMTVTVSEQYQVRFGSYPGNENDLVSAGFIPDSNNSENSGYEYHFESTQWSWHMTAQPKIPGVTGDNYFYVDQSGVIRFTADGSAVGATSAPLN